ncbi:class II fumarate hydratase [Roseivivax marinus]|uniref:class II fumarate hydratase n=1 Tax=Roseivivax marinus TaxID=1379903 RepID=UPI00273ED09B|nr:class II fumarate hydratase [Roseivivax marinus]
MTTRTERDSFGPVEVPADRFWGAQTARALGYFQQTPPRMPLAVIRAFGLQKAAAATANMELGVLEPRLGSAIVSTAERLAAGDLDAHFPLSIWQTGSGTQTNMCANEVLANVANVALGGALGDRAPVHPNDHVNRSQSSNDSFPAVMHIAALREAEARLLPALRDMAEMLATRRAEAGRAGTMRLGRTHLNDAVPVPLAQMFATWGASLDHVRTRLSRVTEDLRPLSQGGTAAGSGLNAPEGFAAAFCAALTDRAGTRFTPAPVPAEGMAAHDALVALAHELRLTAQALARIATDIRHLASGPRAGLAELTLPEDGLSSSIMPGKRNATQAEAMLQISCRLAGNAATAEAANATSVFELNVCKPVLIAAVLDSVDLLSDALPRFAAFVAGVTPNAARMAETIERSLMLATALTPALGYDRVAEITREADASGATIREVVLAHDLMPEAQFDALIATITGRPLKETDR